MKVKVIKSFRDKITKEAIRKGMEVEITEERFSELTAEPYIFVERIEEEPPSEEIGDGNTIALIEPPKDEEPTTEQLIDSELAKEEDPPLSNSSETENLNYEKMTKPELVEYSKNLNIELNMSMTKPEMIERLKSR